MIKLILVRHVVTSANEKGRLSGFADSTLSHLGEGQVYKLADYLKDMPIDKIYTSSSIRTQKTIDLISKSKGIDIEIIENLNELNFGDFDGYTFKEIEKKFPKEYLDLLNDGDNYRFPNGESLVESYNRVSKEIELILKDANSKDIENILVCSHAGSIRNIVSYLISRDYKNHWNYKIDNSSVSIVEIDNGFPVLTMLNNTEFLK
ncbi:histidine phosphatase family protein [Metaclostridioides mangenotii]|uniref:histidine phosphatase family protein n=1 Tax=Metaclostridioides mangenotii TaxID=1540 RepID=UPI00047FF958|nr:histidine phosphatase family protein [Clostridioides mangenotii]